MFSQPQVWRRRLAAVALGLGLALSIFMTSCWWDIFQYRPPTCSQVKPDFYALYSGAKLMWEDSSSLYDLEKQLAVQKPVDPSGADWVLPYFYPPFFALFLTPLAWLPFSAAFAAMTLINILLLAFALILLVRKLELGGEQSLWLGLSTLCNFGVHYGLLEAQNSFIALLLRMLYLPFFPIMPMLFIVLLFLDLKPRHAVRES